MPDTLHRWSSLAWPDFRGLDPERTVVILPVSATEQHGHHLPVSVDADINAALLDAALARLPATTPVLALPPLPYGLSPEHADFPGTITLTAATLLQAWFEIGASVHRSGLRKLVLFNSHGGQTGPAAIVAQRWRSELGMLGVVVNSFGFGEPDGLFPPSEQNHGIHAGANETALMLHLAPAAVRRDRIADCPPASIAIEAGHDVLRVHGPVNMAWQTQDLHASGACGDPRLASAAAGKAILDHGAERFARLLAEISAYPLSALRPGS